VCANLVKWAPVLGLVLTAFGILLGFYWPTTAARWSGPETLVSEYLLQMRFAIGVFLVLAGTILQGIGAWPR
jgi:hypothetical protein